MNKADIVVGCKRFPKNRFQMRVYLDCSYSRREGGERSCKGAQAGSDFQNWFLRLNIRCVEYAIQSVTVNQKVLTQSFLRSQIIQSKYIRYLAG